VPETVQAVQRAGSAAVCIGPAGEHRVLISGIMDDRGHAYARGGVGAVMGSKNLKAVLAAGDHRPGIAEEETLEFVDYEARKWLNASPRTSQGLPEFGTSVLVNIFNWLGILPTRNFQDGEFPQAAAISGERLKREFFDRKAACWGCPIACKRATKTECDAGEGPEFETIYALGSNLGISDFPALIEANYLCNRLGLDTISAGATIACAMELAERGLLRTELRFGRADLLKDTLRDIAARRGLGDELAAGSRRLAEKHGAPDTAMQVKGLELPGYDPRGMQGQGLLYATSNRGACHLRGNMLGPEVLGVPKMMDRHAYRGKAGVLIVLQHSSAVIDSLSMCKFAGFAIGDEFFARLLSAATGVHYEVQDMLTSGERIWNLERLYNLRAGFTSGDDTLPRRFLEVPHGAGGSKGHVVHLPEMLDEYYRFRGWTPQGVPTPAKLKALGLEALAALPEGASHV
jgi:aldehyde:ferredoxin oxidoreductase